MKLFIIATLFTLGAVAFGMLLNRRVIKSILTRCDLAEQADHEPAHLDALELAGGFLSPANQTTTAALEELVTLAAKGGKESSCRRCDVYCASGSAGPDRRAVQIACASCIALELIANKGKNC